MTRIVIGFVAVVIVMIAIPVLLAWSQSRRRLRVERVDGQARVRMPRGHWALLAAIAFIPFAAISVTAFVVTWAPGSEADGRVLGGAMGAAGLALAGWLLALELRGCTLLDDARIERVGAWRRSALAWSEVAKITFNPVNNWFFLTGPAGERLYFAEGLDGIATFAELALQRLPPEVLRASPEAAEALRELARS